MAHLDVALKTEIQNFFPASKDFPDPHSENETFTIFFAKPELKKIEHPRNDFYLNVK